MSDEEPVITSKEVKEVIKTATKGGKKKLSQAKITALANARKSKSKIAQERKEQLKDLENDSWQLKAVYMAMPVTLAILWWMRSSKNVTKEAKSEPQNIQEDSLSALMASIR